MTISDNGLSCTSCNKQQWTISGKKEYIGPEKEVGRGWERAGAVGVGKRLGRTDWVNEGVVKQQQCLLNPYPISYV